MKLLFIAPFTPPYNGNSLPVKFMYDELSINNEITVINVSKKKIISGISIQKFLQTFGVAIEVWRNRKEKDLIYLTVAESFFGNLRDFIFYTIFYKKLDKMVIHMLGGAGMKIILEKKSGLQFRLNKMFICKLGGVIVEGKPQAHFFSKVISESKIHIIPNFAEDFLFTNEQSIKSNFSDLNPIKFLFLSNLLYGKGHEELVQAFLLLDEECKNKISLDFAGGFESDLQRKQFLSKIEGNKQIRYHGHVNGEQKKALYTNAHVFCLPTYYPWEGQPFCILEAYATGCVVITTNHSGISQVFTNNVNGFEVEKKSVEALSYILEKIIRNPENLAKFALSNLIIAKKEYTTSIYKTSVVEVFNKIH